MLCGNTNSIVFNGNFKAFVFPIRDNGNKLLLFMGVAVFQGVAYQVIQHHLQSGTIGNNVHGRFNFIFDENLLHATAKF